MTEQQSNPTRKKVCSVGIPPPEGKLCWGVCDGEIVLTLPQLTRLKFDHTVEYVGNLCEKHRDEAIRNGANLPDSSTWAP